MKKLIEDLYGTGLSKEEYTKRLIELKKEIQKELDIILKINFPKDVNTFR